MSPQHDTSMPGLAGEVVGAVHVAVSDRLHGGGHDGQAGAPGPGRVQPHRGLRHVPRRGHHLPLLLGRQVTHSQTYHDCLLIIYLHICSLLRNASRKQLLSLGHNGSVRWMVHSPTQAAFLSCSDDFRWGYNLSGSRSYSCESLNLYIYFIYNWVMSIKTFWEFLFPNSAVISIISRARFWFRRQ